MNILFLDDNKQRRKSFKSKVPAAQMVETAKACISKLAKDENEVWNFLFLDHDLGGEEYVSSDREDTGMEVVRWIQENEPQIRNIIVHSHNGPAGMEMVRKLQDAQYTAMYVPFSMMIDNLEKVAL